MKRTPFSLPSSPLTPVARPPRRRSTFCPANLEPNHTHSEQPPSPSEFDAMDVDGETDNSEAESEARVDKAEAEEAEADQAEADDIVTFDSDCGTICAQSVTHTIEEDDALTIDQHHNLSEKEVSEVYFHIQQDTVLAEASEKYFPDEVKTIGND